MKKKKRKKKKKTSLVSYNKELAWSSKPQSVTGT